MHRAEPSDQGRTKLERLRIKENPKSEHKRGLSTQDRRGLILDEWNKILEEYTQKGITKETDKLVAISAIAKHFQSQLRLNYVAGIWVAKGAADLAQSDDYGSCFRDGKHAIYENDLLGQLLWYTKTLPMDAYGMPGSPDWIAHEMPNSPRRTEGYCAPTWSWASVSGCIVSQRNRRGSSIMSISLIEIRDWKIQAVVEDCMGQVNGGFLKLRGWLRKSTDMALEYSSKKDCRIRIQEELIDAAFSLHLDDTESFRPDKALFLPVLASEQLELIQGLVIIKMSPLNLYQRVGYFETKGLGSLVVAPPPYRSQYSPSFSEESETVSELEDQKHRETGEGSVGMPPAGNVVPGDGDSTPNPGTMLGLTDAPVSPGVQETLATMPGLTVAGLSNLLRPFEEASPPSSSFRAGELTDIREGSSIDGDTMTGTTQNDTQKFWEYQAQADFLASYDDGDMWTHAILTIV